MTSQSDKKEDFRKYLEKGKVLSVLTTVLTDLFEMENKPEDPVAYITQRFAESANKTTTTNGPQKDLPMSDPKPTPVQTPDLPAVSVPSPPVQPSVPNHHPDTTPAPEASAPVVPVPAPDSQPSPPAQETSVSAQPVQPVLPPAAQALASASAAPSAAPQPPTSQQQAPSAAPAVVAPPVNPSPSPVQ